MRRGAGGEQSEFQLFVLKLLVSAKVARQKLEEAEKLAPEMIDGFRTLFGEKR
jgi:hypothetical protein